GDARVLLGVRVSPDQEEHPVRKARARRPDLLAGDHDLVAVHDTLGRQARQVRPAARLGEALTVDVLAGDDLGQEVGLLLGGPVHDDRRPGQALAHAARYPRQAGPVQFLVQDRDSYRIQAAAAVLRRPAGADQPGVQAGVLPLRVLGADHRLYPPA